MALDLQQRPPEHGHRRYHTRPETEDGRVNSTDAPRSEWGDYRGNVTMIGVAVAYFRYSAPCFLSA